MSARRIPPDRARLEALQAEYRAEPNHTLCRLAIDALEDGRLTGTDLRVLLALGRYANQEGLECWPSVGRLGRDLRIDPRHVRRALRHLESLWYVTLYSPGGGRRLSNTYRVNFAPGWRLQQIAPQTRAEVAPVSGHETRANPAPVSADLDRATFAPQEGQVTPENEGKLRPETGAGFAPRTTHEKPRELPIEPLMSGGGSKKVATEPNGKPTPEEPEPIRHAREVLAAAERLRAKAVQVEGGAA